MLLPRGRASLALPGAILLSCHTLMVLGSGLLLFWLQPPLSFGSGRPGVMVLGTHFVWLQLAS